MKQIFYVDSAMCGGEGLPVDFDLEDFCEVLAGANLGNPGAPDAVEDAGHAPEVYEVVPVVERLEEPAELHTASGVGAILDGVRNSGKRALDALFLKLLLGRDPRTSGTAAF